MEVNFMLKKLREPLGKKPPFIGQENCSLQSFWDALEQSPEWLRIILWSEYIATAQHRAELGATLDFQNRKNTQTKNVISFPSELRFSKLGLFEKPRKSTTTLFRETPRNFKRKNTKCGEVRNLPT
jgi:hypothetical protein